MTENLKELKAALEPFTHGKPCGSLKQFIRADELRHPVNVLKLVQIIEIQEEALKEIESDGKGVGTDIGAHSAGLAAKEALYQAGSIAETIL